MLLVMVLHTVLLALPGSPRAYVVVVRWVYEVLNASDVLVMLMRVLWLALEVCTVAGD